MDFSDSEDEMKKKKPQRLPWLGLVTLLLVISLFVPVEASTPCLTPEVSGQQIRHACGSEGIDSWGECTVTNCCGGDPEAQCRPATV